MDEIPTIRKAELGDAKEISRLVTQLGYNAPSKEIEDRLPVLRGSGKHLVAVATIDEAELAGWVAAEVRLILESGSHVELVGLVVDSSMRRRGIGRALVE